MCYQFGLDLITQFPHHLVCRPDKFDARLMTLLCKFLIFGKESVTGMNRIYALCFCQCDDFTDSQISLNGAFSDADLVRLIGLCTKQRIFILFGVNGYRTDAKLLTCTNDPDCNFTSVCNQNTLEFFHETYLLFDRAEHIRHACSLFFLIF